MTPTVEADQYAEVDFMLHTPIYRQSVELLESWPLSPPDQTIDTINANLSAGQCFQHIRFDSLLTLFGQWFANQQLYSLHLKIRFPVDDTDQAIDITVVDTRFRRIKFYSENGAYLPETLRFYQQTHKSQVLDLYLHNSGRFWIELYPD
ncbi:hypothetical protein GZ77_03660 [Endozoicomonas montiporae]|uniref:Uncharacterized protein n=2 Tax=Endozoicomonas montiporae TaxID=1027273 RepID=A0A081NB60_9GAMM|nr:hypothetical protein [Endozoicomonas montiporae]AMO56601.1 hypothetical protein EZMO1_2522 [Endozoicomonas montiporae CL-33]KEQ15683.1 hypothetical protein GZ77_03660 [Endozoicomonas montiporae]